MGLFVRRYNRFIRKNGIKHSDKNLISFRKQSKEPRQEENKNQRGKRPCYNCGKVGHYKPDCLKMKKDKGKAPPKKFNKQRAYTAWESNSDSSNDDSSSDSDETAYLCLMAHTKN